ncbi:MAG TPA: hypothetical protein VFR67_02235, partial [Pilimelia sp.]|nr:hypothetical protein [Pilimelia sp.]
MAEYWGARAYYFSGGPNGEGTRYTMPEPSNVEFTMPRGENNGTTIETIRQRLLNQHPEDISALADQWQNAYNLLSSIRAQLLDTSNTLYNEHW